ncbi:MAG: YceI family protein [Bacteroidia bacterium]|nr:YceI family protein [Bacteroidia bacterium]MDW8015187.1 YceI family protein [Bacteroidia bacterium]
MKHFSRLFITIILWSACTQAPQAPEAKTQEPQAAPTQLTGKPLKLSLQESKVIAIGTKVTGRHEISFPIEEGEISFAENGCITSGKILLNLQNLQVLDLEGELKQKLEKHLRSADFFMTDQHPKGIFEITNCQKGNGDTLLLSGNLTLRGQTKNITFPVVLKPSEGGLNAKASFNINRQEWGIAYRGRADDLIRDEVNITLDIYAR